MMRNVFATIALLISMGTTQVFAHEIKSGSLVIHHPWIRETLPSAKTAAAYVEIQNNGDKPDHLLAIEVKGAGVSQIHVVENSDEVVKMRAAEQGIDLPAHATVKLEPGSIHLMLSELKGGYMDSEMVDGIMIFQNAGRVPVEFMVEPLSVVATAHKH
jgi:periplasmic copper chaperone A